MGHETDNHLGKGSSTLKALLKVEYKINGTGVLRFIIGNQCCQGEKRNLIVALLDHTAHIII